MNKNENKVYVVRDSQDIYGVFIDKDSGCRFYADRLKKLGFSNNILKNFVRSFVEKPNAVSYRYFGHRIDEYPLKKYPGIIDIND